MKPCPNGAISSAILKISCRLLPQAQKTSDYTPEEKIPGSSPYVFSPYGVDLENFPFNTWRKIAKDILYNGQNTELFQAGPSCGDQDFREAIAGYLHQSRGVICSPDQIIVGAGADYLLILLSQLLDNDSIYAIEDPSYLQAYKTLTNLGKKTYPVPLDKNGMSIDSLRQSGADIAYVTPFPPVSSGHHYAHQAAAGTAPMGL